MSDNEASLATGVLADVPGCTSTHERLGLRWER